MNNVAQIHNNTTHSLLGHMQKHKSKGLYVFRTYKTMKPEYASKTYIDDGEMVTDQRN